MRAKGGDPAAEKTYRLPPISFAVSMLFPPGLLILFGALLAMLFMIGYYLTDTSAGLSNAPFVLYIGLAFGVYALVRAFLASFQFKPAPILGVVVSPEGNLASLIDLICGKLDTRRPDNILIGPDCDLYVTRVRLKLPEGQVLKGRTLYVGRPLLELVRKPEFNALMAHEFAHFSGGDIAYTVYALPVYRSCREGIRRLWSYITAPARGWFIIATLPFRILFVVPLVCLFAYFSVFVLIDSRMSRARESRADAIASDLFGAESTRLALAHVVYLSELWSWMYDRMLRGQMDRGNYFKMLREVAEANSSRSGQMLSAAVRKEERHSFRSHPMLAQRLRGLDFSRARFTVPSADETYRGGDLTWLDQVLCRYVNMDLDNFRHLLELHKVRA